MGGMLISQRARDILFIPAYWRFVVSAVIAMFGLPIFAQNLDALRAQVRAAPEGSWVKVNTNALSSVWTPSNLRPPSYYNNPKGVVDSYGAISWDSTRGDIVAFGGGFGAYAGNEVYRWRGSTQQWERASLPTALDAQNIPVGGAQYAPQSANIGDAVVYLPQADRVWSFGGAAYGGAENYITRNADGTLRRTGPYLFNPALADGNKVGGQTGSGVNPATLGGNMWENRDAYLRADVGPIAPRTYGITTAYLVENGKEVILHSGITGGGSEHTLVKVTIVDPADASKDTWQVAGINWVGSGGRGAAAYDPERKLYIKTYTATKQFTFWDLTNPGPNNRNMTATLASVPAGFTMSSLYGMEYDPVRKRMLLWAGGALSTSSTSEPTTVRVGRSPR